MVTVRPLKRSDIDFVMELTKRENWGYLPLDVKRCLELEPSGCFVAKSNQKLVGHVFSISYGRMGWIGLLIVRSDHRGRGIGTLLTKTALDYLHKADVETVQLEAVQKVVPLYQRLGFVRQFDSLRYCKEQTREKSPAQNVRTHIRPIRRRDVERLVSFDSKYFGANRRKVLERLHGDYPHHCFMAGSGQEIVGYIMARETAHGYWLGPWVCNSKCRSVAEKLLLSCVQTFDYGGELRVGMPAPNLAGTGLMESLGFELSSKSIRMRLGGSKHFGNVKAIYGISGPEKG